MNVRAVVCTTGVVVLLSPVVRRRRTGLIRACGLGHVPMLGALRRAVLECRNHGLVVLSPIPHLATQGLSARG